MSTCFGKSCMTQHRNPDCRGNRNREEATRAKISEEILRIMKLEAERDKLKTENERLKTLARIRGLVHVADEMQALKDRAEAWKAAAECLDPGQCTVPGCKSFHCQRGKRAHGLIEAARKLDDQNSSEPATVKESLEVQREYCICHGYDNNWLSGPFETVEDARAEMMQYDDDYEDLRVHTVRRVQPGDYLPSVLDIVEWMDEQLCSELSPECDFGQMHEITDEAEASAALQLWAEKYISTGTDMLTGDRVEQEGGE